MAEDPEKRFHSIMDKLFQNSPPKSASNSPSPSSSSRGKKRPNPESVLSSVEPQSRANLAEGMHRSSVEAPLCRPWDRGDLMRRVSTFKSMTWFAKPKVISAVNCARKGWINVDMDIIECKACRARLLFSTPSSWSQQQVGKAAKVFSLKLDSGHKLLCPWIDNVCDERLAEFPPTTPPVLVEKFRERSSALLQLLALPVISSSAIEYMRGPQLEEFLRQSPILDYGNEATNITQINSFGVESEAESATLYYQAQKIISLCGWEPRLLPYVVDCKDKLMQSAKNTDILNSSHVVGNGHNQRISFLYPKTNEIVEANDHSSALSGPQADPSSVVLDCRLCGASVGLWTFHTVPRPLEFFKLVGHSEVSNEKNSEKDRGSGDLVDDSGAIGSSVTDAALVSKETQSSLKLTIAGGPPPTKQNFKATISFPVIGRDLRARLSHDSHFRYLTYSKQDDEQSQQGICLETCTIECPIQGTADIAQGSDQSDILAKGHENIGSLDLADYSVADSRNEETCSSILNKLGSQEKGQDGGKDSVQAPVNTEIVSCGAGKDGKQPSLDKAMEFDAIRQHRHFCPWIASTSSGPPGWQQTLSALQHQKENSPLPSTPPPSASLIKVDDPIASVRKLFMSPSAKRMKTISGSGGSTR